MERDEVWRAVEVARLRAADLLAELSPEEWAHKSLCPAWTVRDVGAHLTLAPQTQLGPAMVDMIRAGGNFNRMIRDTAKRRAKRPTDQIIGELRAVSSSRKLAPGTGYLDPLMDTLIHTQDIALPLGRRVPIPLEAARAATTHVWTRGFPFHAQRKLRGFRLSADDVDFAAGEGLVVEGPIEAILLLVSGRPIALDRLSGDGATELKKRLSQ
jgi:uncharacterized protein (TIGR03083 family)